MVGYGVTHAQLLQSVFNVKFGGGVLIAVKKHLRAIRRLDLEFECESVWIEIFVITIAYV